MFAGGDRDSGRELTTRIPDAGRPFNHVGDDGLAIERQHELPRGMHFALGPEVRHAKPEFILGGSWKAPVPVQRSPQGEWQIGRETAGTDHIISVVRPAAEQTYETRRLRGN